MQPKRFAAPGRYQSAEEVSNICWTLGYLGSFW